MAIGNSLLSDPITLIKKDGTLVKEAVPASVQSKKIFIDDVTLPIEAGDHILRKLPSGLDEDYIVTEAHCYTELLPHWEIKYRRSDAPLASTQTIINNIAGNNARININSTDNSYNQITSSSENLFLQLTDALRQHLDQSDARDNLIALVEEMRRGAREGSFTEKYRKFIAAAADHMTIIAPFLPGLSQLL